MIKRVGTHPSTYTFKTNAMTTDTKPLQIFPAMCQEQRQDIEAMLHALDDFGATTFALSANSAQGYTSFIDARSNIRSMFADTFKKYRLVSE